MRIPFAINSYQARSLPLSAQRLINLYAEKSPQDAKMPVVLYGTPGLSLFASVGDGPIRGLHNFNGTLAAVSGDTFYTIDSAGSGTSRGSVEGKGEWAPMASSDTELVVVSNDKGWVWNGTTLTQITDGDFLTPRDVTFQDGYHIFSEKDSNTFFISELRDATSYVATDFALAEGDADDIVAVISDHRELWVFGEQTIEVYYNSGNADFPFERVSGVFIERGCAARHSVAAEDNTIYWLGDDNVIYRAGNYSPERVSTHAVETAIGSYNSVSSAVAGMYTQDGHKFYVISFDGGTWVYDISTGLWHERQSYGFSRWNVNGAAEIYGKVLVGDYKSGNIYQLDLDTYTDNGGVIQRIAHSPSIHASTYRAVIRRFVIELEAGVGLTTGQGSDPQIALSWSDDGGRTFGNEHWTTIGAIGRYGVRAVWRRLGQFRQRVFRLLISDPVKVAIIAANADVEGTD